MTKTIDIDHVKKVLEYCPNYDSIIKYEYQEGDDLTSLLIDWYRELVMAVSTEDTSQLDIITELDKTLNLYINDNQFKKSLRKILNMEEITLETSDIIKKTVKKIINYRVEYENKIVLEPIIPKWL